MALVSSIGGVKVRGHLPALPADFELNARRTYEAARQAAGRASQAAQRALAVTSRALRRWTLFACERLEAVLLSAAGRERVHAIATFSLIFLFAVTSVDFLIAGGAEFGSPARAAQPRAVYAAPAEHSVLPPLPDDFVAAPTALAASLSTARHANVIAVSQSFETPRTNASANQDPTPAHATEAGADPTLAGETEPAGEPAPGATASEPARKRVKPGRSPAQAAAL